MNILKIVLNRFFNGIELFVLKYRYKKQNKHNFTRLKTNVPLEKVVVGNYSYGSLNIIDFGESNSGLKIGNFCSIANDTKFILGGEHNYKHFSTYPFKKMIFERDKCESFSKGRIIVEDDVWIGNGCIILSGVVIGQGAIIGAGSVVRKSIEPYSIYVGDKVIKKRFSDQTIEGLLKTDFYKQDIEYIKSHSNELYNFKDGDQIL
ncbi:CatB-related O-acetyltransferase [Enterococcus casseliflavus]|uniref:CatB-related O-acetyltransferase n=1 Tax=Enterococcus casseliflavus TaxID=37734 RepID=UPI001E506E91|nr:CatB-related O-acetyltransferase [Enterococcus casseliflavus]MCD4961903.1 CatB-related O-acetyltransferase [Enterococcus casseliflavus]